MNRKLKEIAEKSNVKMENGKVVFNSEKDFENFFSNIVQEAAIVANKLEVDENSLLSQFDNLKLHFDLMAKEEKEALKKFGFLK